MARKNNIRKYRKPLNLNIGMLIFGGIFIYVIICIMTYFNSTHIVRYQVLNGSLTTDNLYTGIIIRDENVVKTDIAGYINYYAREGTRVAANDLVYTVDETGRLAQYLEELSTGENSIAEEDLDEFKSEIVDFSHVFDEKNFSNVYDFKFSLKNTVLKLSNASMLESIDELAGGQGVVSLCNARETGIVSYWIDGYEELTPEQVTMDLFDNDDYEKKQLVTNSLFASGDAVYKLSTNEKWSIVIPVDRERGTQLEQEGYIKVKFVKNQYESWAFVQLISNPDGNTYLKLDFNNSMITFCSDRFLDVELIVEDEMGLKIPNSSIVQKEFYLVPETYVIEGKDSNSYQIMRRCYLEDGTPSVETLPISVYSYDNENSEYYLDSTIIDAGDVLCKLDSQETFTVSKKATLIGVYNMNKGYADFKQIIILGQNEEYSVVKPNTQYGLNAYDYIVLDSSTVTDDQFINE